MNKILIFIAILFTQIFIGCKADLEELEDLSTHNFIFLNQDSIQVEFPKLVKGKISVVGYIFSNCVDVCPLTTNNMRLIQEELNKQKISNVEFVSISFDPDVDKPSVLKSFAKVRDLNLANWHFLTGSKDVIDSLMKNVGMVIIKSDSTVYENGLKTYYYVHTDRIQLIDQKGIVRRNYIGSKINILEIVNDIKSLSNK